MSALTDRLKELPLRQRYGVPGLIIFIGLSAWASVERDLFEGLILLGTLISVGFVAFNHFLPSRPQFQVGFRSTPDPGLLRLVPGWQNRPLDQEAIAQEQVDLVMETMPERPTTEVHPDLQIGQLIAQSAMASLHAEINGVNREALQEFENKVAAYGGEVAAWVERFEASREEHLKVFKGKLRVEELGHAPADHVRLRLRFPEGFKFASDLAKVGEPPRPPKFSSSFFDNFRDPIGAQRSPGSFPWPAGKDDEPTYSMENGEPVVECDLGRINQGDRRDAPTFKLRIPGSGSYKVQWEVSSSGLGEPATGSLTIECEAAKEGAAFTRLDQVEAQRKRIERL